MNKKKQNMLILKNTEDPQYYKVDLTSNLVFKDKNILSTSTHYCWEYTVIEQVAHDKWLISLKIITTEQANIAAIQNTTDFIKITNKPLEELVLLLNGNGALAEVQNKSEILEKWNVAKTNYISTRAHITQEEEAVIEKCNHDFRNLQSVLTSSLLHFIFFAPVYDIHPDNTIKRNLTFSSVVNSGAVLYNTVRQKIDHEPDGNNLVVKQHCQHNDYGNINLKKKYNNELMKFLNAPFEYQFCFDALSFYDIKTGLLQSSKASITEQASTEYVYTNLLSISIIQKEELL